MDWYQEGILRIAFDDSSDLILDGKCRVKVDALKWTMAKLHSGRYGDRPAIEDTKSKEIKISWIKNDSSPPALPEPPK